MSTDIKTLENKLNQAILSGKALEAFEELYAENVVMQESSGQSFSGKDTNRKREEEFFGSVAELHDLQLLATAVDDGVSFSEWLYDLTFKDGTRKKLEQAAVRRWENGKVVHERFYYDSAG